MFYQVWSTTVAFLPIRWLDTWEDLGNVTHQERRKPRLLSKPNPSHIIVTLLDSWWLEAKIRISSSHSASQNNTLGPYSKKSIQISISSSTNIVFCFLKLSVFSFCVNTSTALICFTPRSEPRSGSLAVGWALPRLHLQGCRGNSYLKKQTKQMFSSDRSHTVRKLQSMWRNEYECTCVFVPPWSVTACWGRDVCEGELKELGATAGLANECLQGQHQGKN